ncbi:MAG: MBL fold metallo-hydrolase, partial [Eubacteriales bacterium]|nr:MBL fold metallo-hydrolase [Eubacteriales bacterium]
MKPIIFEHPYLKQFTKSFAYITEQGAVLIDTGLYSGRGLIESKTGDVKAVLATHGHWDHTGGHAYFQNKGAAIYLQKRDDPIARDLQHQWDLLYEQFAADFDIPEQRRVIYDTEAGSS